jgi:hypothetical protein
MVEIVEFESQDPAFAGELRMTVSLADADGGTESQSCAKTRQKEFGPKTTSWAVGNLGTSWLLLPE